MSNPSLEDEQDICKACGFCCDGTLFTRVRLTPKDNPESLRAAGLDVREDFSHYFRQPCPQFKNQCCAVYDLRPSQCRKFRCLLLKSFQAGQITAGEANTTIQMAKDLKANYEAGQESKEGYHRFLRQMFGDQNGNPL